jgi:hypothetical protein
MASYPINKTETVTRGRKLPSNLENPFDDALIDLFSWIHPGLYAIGATPNSLTVVSGVFLLASLVALYESYFLLSAVLYIVGYSFDVFDGFPCIINILDLHE